MKIFAFLGFYASLVCSLATDVSGQTIGSIVKGQAVQEGCKQFKNHAFFLDCLTLEDGDGYLSRNVKELPIYAA